MSKQQSWQQEMVESSVWSVPDLTPDLQEGDRSMTYRGLPTVRAKPVVTPKPLSKEAAALLARLYDGSDSVKVVVQGPAKKKPAAPRDRMNGMISILECGIEAMLNAYPASRQAIKHTQRTLDRARDVLLDSTNSGDPVTFRRLLDNYMRLTDLVERRLEDSAKINLPKPPPVAVFDNEETPVCAFDVTRRAAEPYFDDGQTDRTTGTAHPATSADPNSRSWTMPVLNRHEV